MNVVNINDLKTKHFAPHGGKKKIDMKFAFSDLKETGIPSSWEFFGYAEFPVGATAGWHQHVGNDEWFYIIDGEAEIIIDNERHSLKKGDIVLTEDGSYHDIVNVKKKLILIAIEVETKKQP